VQYLPRPGKFVGESLPSPRRVVSTEHSADSRGRDSPTNLPHAAAHKEMTARERLEKWLTEQKVDKNHLIRIETFASLLGANPASRWDLGMQYEVISVCV